MDDMNFNLKVVLDGLRVVYVSHEERKALLSGSERIIDEVFDFVVLDYLHGAVKAGLIPPAVAEDIEALFEEADEFLSPLNPKQQEALLSANPVKVKEWQERAKACMERIEAHNGKLLWASSSEISHNQSGSTGNLKGKYRSLLFGTLAYIFVGFIFFIFDLGQGSIFYQVLLWPLWAVLYGFVGFLRLIDWSPH